MVVDVEARRPRAHHHQLLLLHGESGVDEQHRVAPLLALRAGEERGERALHGAGDGHASLRRDVHADERLDKPRCFLLQHPLAVDVRIERGDAPAQGFHLRLHPDGGGRQAGHAHLHLDEFHARGGFRPGGHGFHFADGGPGEVGNAQVADDVVYQRAVNRCVHFRYAVLMFCF